MTNNDKYVYLNGKELHSVKKTEFDVYKFNYYGCFYTKNNRGSSGFEFKDETDFKVLVYFGEQEKYFEQYFKGNYLFRFHRLKIIKIENDKRRRLSAPITICDLFNRESVVIFSLFTKNPGCDKFHFSDRPTIFESDFELVKRKDYQLSKMITDFSIFDIKPDKKFTFFNLCAQVIGLEVLKERTAVIKIWDGTIPQFDVVDPKTYNDVFEDRYLLRVDKDLEKISKNKEVYIIALGYDHLTFIHKLKPGDYILIHNCFCYRHVKKFKVILEVNDMCRGLSKQLIYIDKESLMGKSLSKKIQESCIIQEQNSFQNTSNQFTNISFDSYLESQESQIITFANQIIDMIDTNKTYKINLKILSLFPLNYDYGDLIYLNCTKCTLNESIKSLFHLDFNNFINSLKNLNFGRKDLTFSYFTCPQCSTVGMSKLRFFIIFVLKDSSYEKLIATLKDEEAENFFGYDPLEILLNKEKRFMFHEKLKFSINKETCNFKIFKEVSKLYYIKRILFF